MYPGTDASSLAALLLITTYFLPVFFVGFYEFLSSDLPICLFVVAIFFAKQNNTTSRVDLAGARQRWAALPFS